MPSAPRTADAVATPRSLNPAARPITPTTNTAAPSRQRTSCAQKYGPQPADQLNLLDEMTDRNAIEVLWPALAAEQVAPQQPLRIERGSAIGLVTPLLIFPSPTSRHVNKCHRNRRTASEILASRSALGRVEANLGKPDEDHESSPSDAATGSGCARHATLAGSAFKPHRCGMATRRFVLRWSRCLRWLAGWPGVPGWQGPR